jgi:transcriptional regulator with XRE-family HTH domain
METTTTNVTGTTIKQRLRERGLSQTDLARAAGMEQTVVSGILNGYVSCGPLRERRMVRGILRLGLHRETPPSAPESEAEQVVFHVPAEGEQDSVDEAS